MLFTSLAFLVFMAVVLPGYYVLQHRWQNLFLLAASYFFYGYWDWRFTTLLAVSTIVDYFVALGIGSSTSPYRRKRLLLLSICVNLGILGFFKYFNFFVSSAGHLLGDLGFNPNTPLLEIVLPVGISFYTFQTMAYTIDVYRGSQQPTRDFVAFALYVCYFPQLVAGPIERAARLLPQIQRGRLVTREQWDSGVQLILWGYAKKMAIADSLAPYVDAAFARPGDVQGIGLLLALYAFALQIYGDFSGYSDIARGVSRLFGIELMENFRQPYLSRNITEFWRRWHISLSSWLRDYLYVPLGGNRRGPARQYINLAATMLLGGLWHGAGWTFVIWGGLHGMYLSLHKVISGHRKIGQERPPKTAREWAGFLVGSFVTFHLVCLSWVFFRARTLDGALDYLSELVVGLFVTAGGGTDGIPGLPATLLFYGVMLLLMDLRCWFSGAEAPFTRESRWWVRGLAYGLGLIVLAFIREPDSEAFIYFQF